MIMLISVLLAACGHENPASQQEPKAKARAEIRILLAPSAMNRLAARSTAVQDIARVTITVSATDMDTITEDLAIEGRKASGALEVPVGIDRIFTVDAYEGNALRYKGSETIDIPAGDPISLDIDLEPATLAIIVKSASESVSPGDRFTAEVRVYNAYQLYAATFVLRYDASLLRIAEAEAGDLLGDDVLFFQRVVPAYAGIGAVSIGATLKGNASGIDGSGVIAVISFEALAGGTAKIEFSTDQRLSLTSPDGSSVAGFDDLIIIDESIVIDRDQ